MSKGWALIGFHVLVVVLLALDLGVFHRKAHEVRTREAAIFTLIWIGLAGLFCGWVGYEYGTKSAIDFATAYVIEKSLSVDNIFVFVVIMTTFAVPPVARHRVLFWGVLGAVLLRAPMIYGGQALLKHFHFMMYVFGGFLVFTGAKIFFEADDDDEDEAEASPAAVAPAEGVAPGAPPTLPVSPEEAQAKKENEKLSGSFVVRLVRRLIPTTDGYRGHHLFVSENGKWIATPLFTTLLVIEFSDVMFALDSIPAVLAVSDDFFVIYTSNIFAILGLRALFFVVSTGVEKFRYLKPALAFILAFVGGKMVAGAYDEHWKVPSGISLGVIALALVVAGVASVRATRREERELAEAGARDEDAPEPAPEKPAPVQGDGGRPASGA